MRALNDVEKKEMKKAENALRLAKVREEEANNEHISYGLNRNTMFLRIYDATITYHNNVKLMRSMMFDQKIIIDCSYDDYMNRVEATNAGKQLMLCFAENRLHDEPFDMHFCSYNPDSITSRVLKRYIPTMFDDDFPLNIHSEALTEKFDKNRLVYLTPHCRNDLEEYSHDDVYIIGAMVDKCNNEPLSLAKAKKQGLRMARLPLDRYLDWNKSGKSLTLNQMVSIMLEMKKHGDWTKALRFVPRRKILDPTRAQPTQPQRFSYDRSRSYQQRQNYGNRQDSSHESQEFNQSNHYQDRQRFQQRQSPSHFSQSYSSDRSRQNYGDRQQMDNRPSFDRNRSFKERKHFDKFKFNLDTWGSNVKSDRNPRDN